MEMLRLPHTGVTPDMLGEIRPLLGVVGLDKARAELDSTEVPEQVAALHRRRSCGTRARTPGVELGASSRAAIHLLSASKAHARLEGRDCVTVEDVRAMAPVRAPPPADRPATTARPPAEAVRAALGRLSGVVPGAGRRPGRPAPTVSSVSASSSARCVEHAREVRAELRRRRGVARAARCRRPRARRRPPARARRKRILDRLRPQRRRRPCSSARPTHRRPSRCRGARAPRHRPSPSPAPAGGTSGTTSPVEPPSFGTRISVSSSPGPTRRLEDAGEEVAAPTTVRSPPAPTIDHLRAEGEHHRRQVRGRVAVRERAADRAPMPHLRVADHPAAVVETIGQCSCRSGSALDGRVTRERADRELRARVPHVGEIGEPADVDELRRPRDAELQRRNERVPAREHLRVGIAAEQARSRARPTRPPRSRTLRESLLRLLDRAPDPLGRGRHLDVGDAEMREGVDDRVDHGRSRRDRAGLPHALRAERVVGRVALRAVELERRQLRRRRDEVRTPASR